MLFEATITVMDNAERNLLDHFLDELHNYRRDPFAASAIVNKLDVLIPHTLLSEFDADEPPAAHSGPTWAPPPLVVGDSPTEAEAVAAFQQFAKSHDAAACVALVKSFNVARVKELAPEQRARFIAEASRAK